MRIRQAFPVLFLIASPLIAQGWSSVSPGASAIDRLRVDPNTPRTLYAKTYGGFYRSQNRGRTWTDATLGLGSGRISSFQVVPTTPTTLFVVKQSTIFRSTDGGRSWASLDLPGGFELDYHAPIVHPRDPKILLLRTGSSDDPTWLRSDDAGVTWEPWDAFGLEGVSGLRFHPTHPEQIYAFANGSLLVTDDGGNTWQTVGSSPGGFTFDLQEPTRLYRFDFRRVMVSTDQGRTWRTTLESFPFSFKSFDQSPSGTLIAQNELALWRSRDRGETWERLRTFSGVDRDGIVAADPRFPDRFFADLHGTGMSRTDDGGDTWISIPLHNPRLNSIRSSADDFVFPATENETVYVPTSSRAIQHTLDAGATWTPGNTRGLAATSIRSVSIPSASPDLIFATTEDSLWTKSEGSNRWKNHGPVINRRLLTSAIHPTDPNHWVVAGESAFFETRDGGKTWQGSSDIYDPRYDDVVFDPIAPHDLLSTRNGELWQELLDRQVLSTDGEPIRAKFLAFAPSDPRRRVAVGCTDLSYSDDGGQSWIRSDLELGSMVGCPTAFVFDPKNSDLQYLATGRGRLRSTGAVFRSTDAGLTWKRWSRGLPSVRLTSALAIDPKTRTVYASVADGIYKRLRNGRGWVKLGRFDRPATALLAQRRAGVFRLWAGTAETGLFLFERPDPR